MFWNQMNQRFDSTNRNNPDNVNIEFSSLHRVRSAQTVVNSLVIALLLMYLNEHVNIGTKVYTT